MRNPGLASDANIHSRLTGNGERETRGRFYFVVGSILIGMFLTAAAIAVFLTAGG